jgi:hypothetical protein
MALVPAANGVESISAAEGIRVTDIGANRFSIGLQVEPEVTLTSDLPAPPYANGLSQYNMGPAFSLQYQGIYLLTIAGIFGTEAGAIVAGPDDRLVVSLANEAGNKLVSVPIKVYNRDVADEVTQLSSATVMVGVDADSDVQAILQIYNVSNTLTMPASIISFNMIPLASSQPNDPGAPALLAPMPVALTPV